MSKVEQEDKPKKGLDLIPNEVIGYRIAPEPHNWTVALVKRKANGLEYKTPLSYHKHLSGAASWIFNTVAQTEGRVLQNESMEKNGIACDPQALQEAFIKAQLETLKAVESLEEDLIKAGILRENINLEVFEKMTGTKVKQDLNDD